MEPDPLLKFLNDVPLALEALKYILGATVGYIGGSIATAYKMGRWRERAKIDSVELAKLKDAIAVANNGRDEERTRANLYEAEIQQLKETRMVDGLFFMVHENKPRNPLCPSCYGKGWSRPL